MGEPQNSHFYDFGIFGRFPEPQKPILFIFGDTRTPGNNREKTEYLETALLQI